MLPGPDPYFDPLEYPLAVLQGFTAFSFESRKPLQILGFFNCILQHLPWYQ